MVAKMVMLLMITMTTKVMMNVVMTVLLVVKFLMMGW